MSEKTIKAWSVAAVVSVLAAGEVWWGFAAFPADTAPEWVVALTALCFFGGICAFAGIAPLAVAEVEIPIPSRRSRLQKRLRALDVTLMEVERALRNLPEGALREGMVQREKELLEARSVLANEIRWGELQGLDKKAARVARRELR